MQAGLNVKELDEATYAVLCKAYEKTFAPEPEPLSSNSPSNPGKIKSKSISHVAEYDGDDLGMDDSDVEDGE
jgi:hypothetical protein